MKGVQMFFGKNPKGPKPAENIFDATVEGILAGINNITDFSHINKWLDQLETFGDANLAGRDSIKAKTQVDIDKVVMTLEQAVKQSPRIALQLHSVIAKASSLKTVADSMEIDHGPVKGNKVVPSRGRGNSG